MEKQAHKKVVQRLGFGLLIACFLETIGSMVITNYGPYIFTDIAGIPYNIASACLFAASVLSFINAIFAGAQIQKTRSKMGQYRPWEAIGSPVILIGGLLMFIKTSNIILTTVLVSLGYFSFQIISNYIAPAEFGLQMKMAGDDSDLRNTLASRYWIGCNIAYVISGFLLVPLIDLLGKSSEAIGFSLTHALLGILACVGTVIFLRISKDYDRMDNSTAVPEEENVSFLEMIKGVIYNRPGRVVFLAEIFRQLAYMSLMALMAYQCEYVIGDMMGLSYFLAGSGILAVIGNMIAPMIAEKLGGRKKTVMISAVFGAIGFAAVIFVGMSLWGFVIATCVGYFFIAITDTLVPVMFGDAGEYYLHKEGKDTRAYMLSMSGLAGKAGFSLSTLVLGAVLGLIAYDPGAVMSAEHAGMLNFATGAVPAVCYLIYVVILLFHGISDKEIEACIEENAQKYGEMPE